MNLFYYSWNFKIYLVTGGLHGDRERLVSTEVMAASGSSWAYVGNLPKAANVMSGISVNNQIFITGEWYEKQTFNNIDWNYDILYSYHNTTKSKQKF